MSTMTCLSCQNGKQVSRDWRGRENRIECAEGIPDAPKNADACPLFLYEPGTDEAERHA